MFDRTLKRLTARADAKGNLRKGNEMSDDVGIEYDELEKETESAFLITIDSEKIWIPKSQARHYDANKKIYIPEWLANKKGLI